MELYRYYGYYGYFRCEQVVGLVRAKNMCEAEQILKNVYDDYDLWEEKTLEKIEFDDDGVCEVYYGG